VQGKNRHYRWNEIHGRHWLETAKRCGLGGMQSIVRDVIDRTPDVVKQVHAKIPKGVPAQIADSIMDGIKACTERLKADLSS